MEIHTYSKHELAMAYAPTLTPVAALNRLAQWIKTNPRLCKDLAETGYQTNQRHFNSRQVKLIFDCFGEP
ncbi:MAG: DUF4248 domain-containing protein [Bacteroidaceae bacterium]|nr:DUF4248 domain-containing protein [Candidatus Minthousia equi]MCQ2245496.1 DUF4248 domain-containing protein [Bacteroidaceae bacterium]